LVCKTERRSVLLWVSHSVLYWVSSTQAASVAAASLSAWMSVVLKDVTTDESLAAKTAGLLVASSVASWECPSVDLKAVQTAGEWDVSWAVQLADSTAARLVDLTAVRLAGCWDAHWTDHSVVHWVWVLYWVAKMVALTVPRLGRLRAELLDYNLVVSRDYSMVCLAVARKARSWD
jgi:hypothetical protein